MTSLALMGFVATMLMVIPSTVTAKRQGSFTASASISSDGKLRIQNRRGDIVVIGGASDFVQVRAEIRDTTERGDHPGRYTPAEIIAYLERKPPVVQEDDEVCVGCTVDDDFQLGVAIDYQITVPAGVSLEIEAEYGTLEIHETGRRTEIHKNSGRVQIQQPRGELTAKVHDGSLQVFGTPHEEWSLESKTANVEVVVPAGLAFELDAESDEGSLMSDFPLGEHKKGRFDGAINGGGQRIHIRSERGAVTIRER